MFDSATIAITTVLSILVIVDIVGNSLVCAIVKRNRDLRIPINFLIVNLAVADILFAAFITPSVFSDLTYTNHPDGVAGTVLCKLFTHGNVAWLAAASSIVTLVAISIERYHAVMHPLDNKWKLTVNKLKWVISGSWVIAVIPSLPLFLATDIVKDEHSTFCLYVWPQSWMAQGHSLAWLLYTLLPMMLMIVLYAKVVYTLWFKRNDNSQLTHQQMGVIKVRKRVTLMVVTVTAIFGICWGADASRYAAYNIAPVPVAITNTMVLFNSAVNPFVYALLNQQFREKMKGMICCTRSLAARVHPTSELHNMGSAINIANSTHNTRPSVTQ
ncbi:hypothetical protein ACROYT_G038826 [Oculina patagonica]